MSAKSLQALLGSSPIVGVGSSGSRRLEPSEMDIAIVDSVFEKLKILFPVGAPKSEVEGTHKAEWLKTLAAQKIRDRDQVQYGLNRARSEVGERKYWPSPRQFCIWCLPCANDAGLPETEQAFREALKHYRTAASHSWTHEVVWLAMRETGNWMFSRGKKKDVFEVFTRNYDVLVRRFLAGEKFDIELPKALPPKVNIPTKPDDAKQNIALIRKRLDLRGSNDCN
ncbi:replication protein P [Shewanella psychropiezotolerans]|uniref:Replication protein P n=1 Tax=Shewanella psychropiezotolerans TaxID=2593655 RepID=A0ABX5WZK7_9GAMM|nr:replication protein P [Shewanella psychropiezotolerans]QDO84525.1 replication protein P [Shewanella psychropiezotolerans]